MRDVQEFLQKEFDLHVTVSTISRQLSRAGHARARRPGYKNTRPDLQAAAQAEQQQDQQLQQPDAQMQDDSAFDPQLQQSPGQGVDDGNAAAAPESDNMKLACPFLKLNPARYIDTPFCQSTWHSARDVKCVSATLAHFS